MRNPKILKAVIGSYENCIYNNLKSAAKYMRSILKFSKNPEVNEKYLPMKNALENMLIKLNKEKNVYRQHRKEVKRTS